MKKETTVERIGRILVVDDSTANLQLLTNLLSEHGYTLHPASDGELALEFVQTILPDLILLDIKMPGMDGYEVCRRLKADERTRSIPIIFISVLEDERNKVKGFQAGGVDYINKPFHADEVLARVNTHLTLRRMQLELEWSNAELRAARDTLEERVRERSAELEQANRKLQQAQKMEAIGTLAGGIAHDFNNILGAVMGYAEMARDDVPEGSLTRSHLEEVLKAADRAKELTKQILVFSRKGESEPGQEWSGVQISLIIKEALKLLRATLPTTVEIRQNLTAPSNSAVMADPTQIHQVLMNLCTNAGYAMRETGGVLVVGLAEADLDHRAAATGPNLESGRYLKLTVSDTGHGMDRATMEKIFDPFFTTKPQGEGTGMGLSVVHGIVKSHGGYITVCSEPGQGSVFHVYLPRLEQASALSPVEDANIPTGKGRILLVDDEKTIAEVGQQILERLGYQVTAMISSVDAFEVFRAQPDEFDLIITDYTMPKMTGTVLAGEIRGIRPDIPIILCTGFSEMITKEKAERIGIRAFIMKPLTMGEMARIVSDVLNRKNG